MILNRIASKFLKNTEFQPYQKGIQIGNLNGNFFFATPQAKEWYDPIKPYALLEYEWVINNIDLKGKNIIDGGAHHGQYSLVLALGAEKKCNLISVDPFEMNCLLTKINLQNNGIKFNILQKALSTSIGTTQFTTESNGRISEKGDLIVETTTLEDLMIDVNVVKLDIEGHEFEVIPHSIDKIKNVEAWIVEIHPTNINKPDTIIKLFTERGYTVHWVNRAKNIVEPYKIGTQWDIHSSIFAIK